MSFGVERGGFRQKSRPER